MLCAIDEWKMEGKMEKSISIINNMKNMGMDWGIISKATGLNQQQYEKLQIKYQHLISMPSLSLET